MAHARLRSTRRWAAVRWMEMYNDAQHLGQAYACTRSHVFRVRARTCANQGAPFPLPPRPHCWWDDALGGWADKWVYYDALLQLAWEADTLQNRLLRHRSGYLVYA